MRITRTTWLARLAIVAAIFVAGLMPARVEALAPNDEPSAEDLLGELFVEAAERKAPLKLIKLAVVSAPPAGKQGQRIFDIVRRDLELCGEFDVRDAPTEQGAEIDREALRRQGFELALQVEIGARARAEVPTAARVISLARSEDAPLLATLPVSTLDLRRGAHELADRIIGLATGYRGPFLSRLAFVRTANGSRTVTLIDADGHDMREVSKPDQVALSPAFGPDDRVYYAASRNHGRYRLYRVGDRDPIDVSPAGSIYGIAFTDDRKRAALSIAVGSEIRVHVGSSTFGDLAVASKPSIALHPAFSNRGDLAFAGTVQHRQRIYVGGRPVSRAGASASSPSFCPHPDETKLVYSVGARDRAVIVVADERGRKAGRVTDARARHSSPACSPDGRLIAFFSTRRGGEGPGLYLMRIDGHRARKIAPVLGDSLRWARITPAVAAVTPPI